MGPCAVCRAWKRWNLCIPLMRCVSSETIWIFVNNFAWKFMCRGFLAAAMPCWMRRRASWDAKVADASWILFIYYYCWAMFTHFSLLSAFVESSTFIFRHFSAFKWRTPVEWIVSQRKVKRKLLSVRKSFNSFHFPPNQTLFYRRRRMEKLRNSERERETERGIIFKNCAPNQSMTNCIILICGTALKKISRNIAWTNS